jgi:tripartite-type tricarboxylate transporter receptor subunit TctC
MTDEISRITRRRGLMLAAALTSTALLAAAAALPAVAQDAYPSRPVTVVVPQAPAGTNDIIARVLADKLGDVLGQARFVVENRPGAGGNIGTASAARGTPDGYTLLVTISSTQAINPALYAKLGFDPVKDFEPISLLATVPNVLVAHPSLPADTLPELIALAKAQAADPIQYASAGNGTLNHLLGEMLKSRAGIPLTHVPYRGVGPAINDMVAGHVKLGFASMPSVMSHLQGKVLKPLAMSSATRSPAAPDIPAIAETLPGFAADLWVALFAPKGTPQAIRDRLHAATLKAMADSGVQEKLKAQGATIVTSTPDELARRLDADITSWAEVVKAAGARIE